MSDSLIGADEFAKVPRELLQTGRFCLWKYETVPGRKKKTKVPYSPRGFRVDTTQPDQFNTFSEVIEVRSKYSGVGVLMTSKDSWAAIDIDDCVTPGGNLLDWADEIVALIDSYTEISPSGRGIRIFARTTWKPPIEGKQGAKRGGTEIYFAKRFLTITGRHLEGTPLTIEDRTGELKDMFYQLSSPMDDPEFANIDVFKTNDGDGNGDSNNNGHGDGNGKKTLTVVKDLPEDFLSKIRKRSAAMADRIETEEGALRAGADVVESMYTAGSGDARVDRSRNDMHIALWMCNHGYSPEECLAVLTHRKWFSGSKSREVGTMQYAKTTVIQAIKAVQSRIKNLPDSQKNFTELGNAERLVESYGNNMRYCKALGGWLVWSGTCWVPDDTRLVDRCLREVVRSLHISAAGEQDPDRSQAAKKWAYRSEDHRTWYGALTLAQTLEGITLPLSAFDRHLWSFPALNGVIDLRTGDLKEHAREFYFTATSPIAYDPDARCPRFREALAMWLPNPELQIFIQRAAGYTLTGSISEQVLFFLYGTGHNGKTTFIQVLQHIMGRYCRRITTEAVTQQKGGSPGTLRDQAAARLAGARMGVVSEVERNMRLAEGWIKDITGGGAVATKVLYENPSEVVPTAKIFFDANHRPRVMSFVDEDHAELDAFWRRFREIPFLSQVPESSRVKDYHNILLAEEGAGILTWAVEGCLDWQQNGLPVPTAIKNANKSYRDEVDSIRPFIANWLTPEAGAHAPVRDVYMAYKRHCAEDGETSCSKKELKQRLQERGLLIGWDSGQESWIGYRLTRSPYEYSL